MHVYEYITMNIKLTEIAKQLFLDSLAGVRQADDNPFYREGNKLFLRYDALQLSSDNGPDSIECSFMWRDKVMHSVETNGVGFTDGNTLTIMAIEGRVEIKSLDNW